MRQSGLGDTPRSLPPLAPTDAIIIGDAVLTQLDLVIFAVAVAVMLLLFCMFRYTCVGRAMRAVGMNPKAARLTGVNLARIRMLVWALAGLISSVAALLITPKILITPDIGHIAILAYAAAIVGGITSLARRRGRRFRDRRGREPGGPVHFHQRHRGRALRRHHERAAAASARPAGRQTAGEESMKTNRIDHALLALMAIALAVLPFYTSGYVIYVVNLLLVFVVLALGLHLVIGETGQFALSHAAFYGVGIYTAGLINNLWHPPFFVSIVAGGCWPP